MEESKLYIDEDMESGDLVSVASGEAAILTARCPGAARANEDTAAIVAIDDNSGVLIVADGMGGGRSGDKASQIAVKTLVAAVKAAIRDQLPLRSAILDGFERANQAVLDLGIGAATTLAVLEIQGPIIRPYHVGDSVILAIGQRGKIKLQTVSHSPVGYAVEAGYLEEQDAIFHAERHLVSNVIGSPGMHIALGPELRLSKRDTVILSSDGRFDNLHTTEIIERCRKGPLQEVVGNLARECHARMVSPENDHPSKPDDVTIITFRINGNSDDRSSRPAGKALF